MKSSYVIDFDDIQIDAVKSKQLNKVEVTKVGSLGLRLDFDLGLTWKQNFTTADERDDHYDIIMGVKPGHVDIF